MCVCVWTYLSCHKNRSDFQHEDILHTHLRDTNAHICDSHRTADDHTPAEAHTHQTVVTHTHRHYTPTHKSDSCYTHTHTPGHSATLDWHTVSPPAAGRTHMSVDWPSDMEHSHLTERERESNSTPRSSSVWIHSSVSVRWVIPAWQLSAQVCIRHGSVRLQICAQLQALALQRRGTRDDFPHRQEILTILGQGGHGPETHITFGFTWKLLMNEI